MATSTPRRTIKAVVPAEKPEPMEIVFWEEKHREDASYRTNWKATVAELVSTRNLEVTVFRIVFETGRAIRVLPRAGATHIPLATVFGAVDVVP